MAGDFHLNKLKMLAMFLCVLLFAQNIAVVQATEPTTLSDPQATLSSLAINEQLGDGSSSVELTVTGTYSDNSTQPLSGPDLVWRSSDPNVATVNTDGNVTFTGKNGAVTITVSYQNTDKTASVQTTVSTGMSLSSFTVSPATLDGTSTVKLTATGQYSLAGSPAPVPTALDPLGIVWKSSNDAIATVDSKGVVTLKGIGGTVSIDATYQQKVVKTTLKVPDSITIGSLAYSTTPVQLAAKGVFGTISEPVAATWTSDNTEVATVDQSGKVTFSGATGLVTITASYLGVTKSVSVNIAQSISINETLAYSSAPVQLTVKATYKDGSTANVTGATWRSDNPSVATVDSNGKVFFTGKNGEVTITATYQGKSTTAFTNVTTPGTLTSIVILESLSYSSTPVQLSVNGFYSNQTIQPISGAAWTSSNPSVATVDQNGLVTFTGVNGAVTITATYGGFTNAVGTVVNRPIPTQLTGITINESLSYSTTPVQLSVKATYSDHTTQYVSSGVTWSSSNPSVASVDPNGRVIFTGNNGSVTITASYSGFNATVFATVTQGGQGPTPTYLSSIKITGTLAYSQTPITLTATGYYSNNTTTSLANVSWTSSNILIARVSSKGVVTFTGKEGTVTITATYQGFKDTASTTVTKDTLKPTSIEISPALDYDDDPVKLKLYALYGSTTGKTEVTGTGVTWSSNNSRVATVSQAGVVSFTGRSGKVTITATYQGLTATVSTTVDDDLVESISIREKLEYDDVDVELSVRVKYADGSSKVMEKVSWSSDNTKVAKVSSKGVVTFTGKTGKVTITAKYKGQTDKIRATVTSTDINRSSSSGKNNGSSSSSGSSGSSTSTKKPFASNVVDTATVEWNVITLAKNASSMNVREFSDTSYHWARKELKLARALNLVKGEPDGTFRPDNYITREEFVALISRAFQISPLSTNSFRDTQNSWAKGYISALVRKGVIRGNEDGTFKPESNITRAEMVTIISRLINFNEVSTVGTPYFSDIHYHWAKDTITQVSQIGLVRGVERDRFAPEGRTTRAEAIVLLLRTLQLNSKISEAISSAL